MDALRWARNPPAGELLRGRMTIMGKDPSQGKYSYGKTTSLSDPSNPYSAPLESAYITENSSGVTRSVQDASKYGFGPLPAAPTGGGTPTPNHVAGLKANPATAAQFDQIYGAGAAKKIVREPDNLFV